MRDRHRLREDCHYLSDIGAVFQTHAIEFASRWSSGPRKRRIPLVETRDLRDEFRDSISWPGEDETNCLALHTNAAHDC